MFHTLPEKLFHYEWSETPQQQRRSRRHGEGHAVAPNFELAQGARYHRWFKRFIDDIRDGQPGLLNMDDALHVMETIDAAYESSRTGTRIEVEHAI